MDVSTAEWLVSPDAADALAAAEAEADPDSLAAASRLRAWLNPERAAAALDQASLRRRARRRLGEGVSGLFWTPTGLEQATRPAVSQRRARRFAALLGPLRTDRLVDLTSGCGADAVAFVRAGLCVTAVESDAVTAAFAQANLRLAHADGGRFLPLVGKESSTLTPTTPTTSPHCPPAASPGTPTVLLGDAEELAEGLLGPDAAVFIDPSRRSAAGRSWRVEDLRPSWAFVTSLLDGSRVACAKLGPGLPHALIPDAVEAEWVSVQGDLVEAALWSGPGTTAGLRRAAVGGHDLTRIGPLAPPPIGPVDAYVYEPDPAVIRAGLVPALADRIHAHRVHDQVAYLTAPTHTTTPFATAFEVLDQLPYSEKGLRAWVRQRGIGVLEIKKRGIDVDPAALRKRLRPSGKNQATLLLTPTASGAVALVVRRLDAAPHS